MEGIDISFVEEGTGEAEGFAGLGFCFPGVSDHAGDVGFEAGLFGHADGVFDVGGPAAFMDLGEGFLGGGLESKQKEAKTGACHEVVLGLGKNAWNHIAAERDAAGVTSSDDEFAEFPEPLAGGKAAGIIEDFPDAIVLDKVADLVGDLFRGADTPAGVEGGPGAEGAFAPPTIAAGHDIGAGSISEIAIFVGVQLPACKVPVNQGEVFQSVGECEWAGVCEAAGFSVPDSRRPIGGIVPVAEKILEKEIVIAPC